MEELHYKKYIKYCKLFKFSSKIKYSLLCGKIIGYQYWSPNRKPDALNIGILDIDSHYVDGVSLTYGSLRKCIWTSIITNLENEKNCPCTTSITVTVPSFIENDYFCETGSPSFQPKIIF